MADGALGNFGTTPSGGVFFSDAVRWVIEVAEGGSRLVSDSGGLTKFGISKRAFPNVDIEALTREGAEALYLEHYWRAIKANALPPALALVLFDTAVNMGVATAVRLLQTSLRINADGIMGPETVSAAKVFLPRHELVALVVELRLRWYEDLAKRYPKYMPYLYGWRMRCVRLALEAGRWRGL